MCATAHAVDTRRGGRGTVHAQKSWRARAAIGIATMSLLVAACGGGATNKGTVNIAINAWVGYEANAAVIAYLLETELKYTVVKKSIGEQVSWEGFESGEVDAIVENWGHSDLAQIYITEKAVAVDAGSTGVNGIIGWYVPPWMVAEHPDIVDGTKLNDYVDLFKTSESGDKGQLLDGDPAFVTYDEAILRNLGLNYEVVYAGSEAALIEAFRSAEANKTPLLGYFYSPQWFLAEVPLVHIELPPYEAGCDPDPGDLTTIECTDYPAYTDLNKIIRKKFADEKADAAKFITNFKWSAEHQNQVSFYITSDGMTPEAAAEKWVKDNESVWKAWLP
jgi:glycine betaine/proline transport system substrate-binding protein